MDTNLPVSESPRCPRSGADWRLPLLLAVVLLGMVLWNQTQAPSSVERSPTSVRWAPDPRPEGPIVRLEIDFGNGTRRVWDSLPYRDGMTVADVLKAAANFKPGITYRWVGEGERAFLDSLEFVENEGAGGRNWLYEVAGRPGTQSFYVESVGAGDLVRWSFAGASPTR